MLWAVAVLGCPCRCLPWFLLFWKLDSLEQHLQAFVVRENTKNPQNALRHPFSGVLCYNVMDQRTLGATSLWKRGLLIQKNLLCWAANTFIYLRKWHVLPPVQSFLDLWEAFIPLDVKNLWPVIQTWANIASSDDAGFNRPRHRYYSPNTRFFCFQSALDSIKKGLEVESEQLLSCSLSTAIEMLFYRRKLEITLLLVCTGVFSQLHNRAEE